MRNLWIEGIIEEYEKKGFSHGEIYHYIESNEQLDLSDNSMERIRDRLDSVCPSCEQNMFYNQKEREFVCPICE